MESKAIVIISAIAQDVMAANGIQGSAIVGGLLSAYQNKRAVAGRDILMKRITEGQIDIQDAANQDDFIGIVYSYMQAASKGSARINLDLLAQAIVGEMNRHTLYADKFHKYINILSTLTRDEIFLIGSYLRMYKITSFMAKRKKDLSVHYVRENTWHQLIRHHVPKDFRSEEDIKIIMSGLVRTGLVNGLQTSIQEVGTPAFTKLLYEVTKVIDFKKSYKEYPDY